MSYKSLDFFEKCEVELDDNQLFMIDTLHTIEKKIEKFGFPFISNGKIPPIQE